MMTIEQVLNFNLLLKNRLIQFGLPALSFILIVHAHVWVFLIVPSEQIMGAVQRIFYFHVSAAIVAYFAIALLLIASSFYLVSKKIEWDLLAQSSASVAFLLCSIVLASGMIWGHSAWNTWWRWEPRLVSFLVLWLILFSYVLLRNFAEGNQLERNFAAVLGIIASINVPIVIYSIKILAASEQLHPEVVAKQGLGDPRFSYALIASMLAVLVFAIWLLIVKFNQLLIEEKYRDLEVA